MIGEPAELEPGTFLSAFNIGNPFGDKYNQGSDVTVQLTGNYLSLGPVTLRIMRRPFEFTSYMGVDEALNLGRALIDAAIVVMAQDKQRELEKDDEDA